MNKILRMAFVAAVALVSANTFAQNADVTFSLTKMVDNGWEKGQSLDNVEYSQKNVTIAFSKADGETDPIYREVEDSKGNKSVIAALTIGNKLTLTSDKFTFTKIQFKPTAKGKSPKSEKSGPNYEMTNGTYVGPEGETNETKYVWEGETSEFFIKNLNNKNGIEFNSIMIWYKEGFTSGVSVVELNLKNGKVYDLNGTYVGNSLDNVTKSGVYVINGKKTVVKK
ncbi:hypothetical protein [Prevotella sp.]|uniref:hypothetical protein n=1 Tax=Prevotella sp. TaxID=59823 RepID=UPI002E761FBE|nr:hypothetical protein [Prevotella sp.]MEE0669285.1 hypothetical protein [Prevotella sp.]